jgi:uncharacterized protein
VTGPRSGWEGTWTTAPERVETHGSDLVVTARRGSDAWRTTAHGYVTDSAHALLRPLREGEAVDVEFEAPLTRQFDQAGLVLRADAAHWIKAGLEFADGLLQLGVVVTRDTSDWSSAPVPEWAGRRATVSASRTGDAVLIRARVDDEPFRLIRVAWVDPSLALGAGPYVAAPTRDGLTVRFTGWRSGAADAVVHPDGLPDAEPEAVSARRR